MRNFVEIDFVEIGPSVAEILQFFDFFFKMAAAAMLDFRNRKFYWLMESRGPRRTIIPNFVKIGQSIVEILRFFKFSRWRPSTILDLFGKYLDHPWRVLGNFYRCAKFGYDRFSSFDNMNVSIFGAFGWKKAYSRPKNWVSYWCTVALKCTDATVAEIWARVGPTNRSKDGRMDTDGRIEALLNGTYRRTGP